MKERARKKSGDDFRVMLCAVQRVALVLAVAWLPSCSALVGNCPFYKSTVGDFNLTVVSDGASTGLPLASFLPDDSPQGVLKQVRALHFLPDLVKPDYNVVHLETGQHRVLIDAGSSDKSGPSLGKLLENMALAELNPNDVDVVLFSHAHPDHISGAIKPDGSHAFPNAKYMMSRIEYEFWTKASLKQDAIRGWGVSEDVKAGMLEGIKASINALQDKMELFEFGDDILPGITSKGLPGHTPGHSGFLLRYNPISLQHFCYFKGLQAFDLNFIQFVVVVSNLDLNPVQQVCCGSVLV